MTGLSAGASAVETILQNRPENRVVVFAIWEPILPTDWSSPGDSVLHRLHDRRVEQFWDPGHLLAAAIQKAETAGQLQARCCAHHGVFWDLTAAYAPGARWGDMLPEPILLNGTVVQTAPKLKPIVDAAN